MQQNGWVRSHLLEVEEFRQLGVSHRISSLLSENAIEDDLRWDSLASRWGDEKGRECEFALCFTSKYNMYIEDQRRYQSGFFLVQYVVNCNRFCVNVVCFL